MKLEDLKARIELNKAKSLETASGGFFSFYINHYNLKTGLDKVPTYLLYYAYKSLIAQHEEELPLSNPCFFKELKTHFKAIRWGKQRYYLLDKQSIINIDDNLEFKAKLWNKKRKVIKQEYCITIGKILEYETSAENRIKILKEIKNNTDQIQEREELLDA